MAEFETLNITRGANGRANCILEICCGAVASQTALSAHLVEHGGCTKEQADLAATCLKRDFDLAPPGSLKGLYSEIRRLAREGYTRNPTGDGG